MRHRNKTKKLGRTKAHRKVTLRNLATAILEHHQIKTTLAKSKAARSYVEKLITTGKKDSLAARRQAFKLLQNHRLVKKLFDEIAPTFSERSGGYTRVIKLGRRRGDGAELAILQLVGFEPVLIEEKKPSEKKKKAAPAKKEKKDACCGAKRFVASACVACRRDVLPVLVQLNQPQCENAAILFVCQPG